MKIGIYKKTIFLLFLFSVVPAINIYPQTALDSNTEFEGSYLHQEQNNFSYYVIGQNQGKHTRDIAIQKSTIHIGKFKFILSDQYISAGGSKPNITITNLILDGIEIHPDGTIPQQEIESAAKTQNESNIIFSVEALKGNGTPASFITKNADDANAIKYHLRFEIKATLKYGNESYVTKLVYSQLTRIASPFQKLLNLDTELAGSYLHQRDNNAYYSVNTGAQNQKSTRNVIVANSTAQVGKFTITLPDHYLNPWDGYHATIKNMVLDGVQINTDGIIPIQEIATKASTSYNDNVKFTIESTKEDGTPASFITKDDSNPDTIKYTLRLEIRASLKYSKMGSRYETKLVYTDVARLLTSDALDVNPENLGEYRGNLYWGLIMMDSGNIPDHPVFIGRGTEEATYKLGMDPFSFKMGMATINIPQININNLIVDENGYFIEKEITIPVHVYAPLLHNQTHELKAVLIDSLSYMKGDYKIKLEILTDKINAAGGPYQVKIIYKGERPRDKAPGEVSELTAIADSTGKHEATLSFVAPTINFANEPLEHLSSIKIFKEDKDENNTSTLIHEIPEASIGVSYSWTDKNAHNGENSYKLMAHSSTFGSSNLSLISVFVGSDVPKAIKNLTLQQKGEDAELMWDAPDTIGANGQPVYPDSVYYKIVRNDGEVVAEKAVGTSTFTDTSLPSDKQSFVFYTLYPYTASGQGDSSITAKHYSFGPALPIPFKESFSSTIFEHNPWTIDPIKATKLSAKWQLFEQLSSSMTAQDNDKGLIGIKRSTAAQGDTIRLVSPAIKIKSLTEAKLSFWFYHQQKKASNDLLEIEISVDNSDFISLKSIKIRDAEKSSWTQYIIPLDNYTDSEKVSFGFKAIYVERVDDFAIDNISVTGKESTTQINELENRESEISIFTKNKKVIIKGAATKEIKVYTIDGHLIGIFPANDTTIIPLEQGVYLLEINKKIEKIVIP